MTMSAVSGAGVTEVLRALRARIRAEAKAAAPQDEAEEPWSPV